ncbi:hypothetical protein KAI46_06410 [bacterium]|nr:hypothetical protein [bacterium]
MLTQKRTVCLIILGISFFLFFFPKQSFSKVAIYNDGNAPAGYSGSWSEGVIALKHMLVYLGYDYEEISYETINDERICLLDQYESIVFPGGYAQWYNYWISQAGKRRIRDFVAQGGNYFGICAGAYFACNRINWEGILYDGDAGYNYWGELTGYDLDLFPGTGIGPLNEIAHWDFEGYDMTTISFNANNVILKDYSSTDFDEDILYYGGPFFTVDAGQQVDILGNYDYNGEAAVIAFRYGFGKVVLFGPHPEIEEDSFRDGVTIDREELMDDNGSDWDLVETLFDWLHTPESPIIHEIVPPVNNQVAQGERLGPFYPTLENLSVIEIAVQQKSYIVKPDGGLGFKRGRHKIIPSSSSFQPNFGNGLYLMVPEMAPIGETLFCVTFSDNSDNLLDHDCFDFMVTSQKTGR